MGLKSLENEKSVLRWGGLAGILAFIVWIVDMPLYAVADPFIPEGLMRFPDVRLALGMNTVLCIATALLSIAFILVLYRVLRRTRQAPALIGTVFSVIGYIGIALGDVSTFFAFDPLANLYHAPAATPEAQATVVVLWEATQGITHTFAFMGGFFLMVGFVVLGLAMIGAPAFGRRFGGTSIVLGVVGTIGVVVSLSVFEAIGLIFLVDLIFLPLFGWKIYSLSH
jgi:hypothetical protein